MGCAGSLYGVRVKWLRWFAHPFGGIEVRGHAQHLAFYSCSLHLVFSPSPSEVAGLFLSFLELFAPSCPWFVPTAMYSVTSNPVQFPCILLLKENFKHCNTAAKGPRSQPVSVSQLCAPAAVSTFQSCHNFFFLFVCMVLISILKLCITLS